MAWYDKTPKSIDVEELVKRLINEYAENKTHSVRDENNNTYKVLVYNQDFVKDLSKALVSKIFGVLFNQVSSVPGSKSSRDSDELLNALNHIDRTTFDGLTYKNEKDGKSYYTLSLLKNKQTEITNILETIQTELSRLSQVQETVIRENSSIIQKQHDSLLRYDNDLLYKTKIPLLKEVIDISDQIKQIADDQQSTKDYSKLIEDVHALGEWVDATLQTESVRKYEYAKEITSKFDSKYQEIVETQYTSKIEEDGMYKTMLPGYFWTIPMVGASIPQTAENLPKSFEFILRHEQVVRLKYKPEHGEPMLANDEMVLLRKEVPTVNDVDMGDSKKTTKVEDLLTLKNDYGKEKIDQVLLSEDECDSSKESLKDKISNGQAMQLGHSRGLLLGEQVSPLKDNKRPKGKSKK